MYHDKNNVIPSSVVWASRNVFYDQPDKTIDKQINMFLVLKTEDMHFYGCKLEKNPTGGTNNVLKKKFYPLKYDSRVAANIYKIPFNDIVNNFTFMVTQGTFQNIKRNIYKRIILGHNEGPVEYQEMFVNDFLKDNQPQVDNIIVYPSEEKQYKYYYIYDDMGDYYSLIQLQKEEKDHFSVLDSKEILVPKQARYFDCYDNHTLSREEVEEYLFGVKTKTLSINNKK